MEDNLDQLKYPIGKFTHPSIITDVEIYNWIKIIAEFPTMLKNEVADLSEKDLSKTYRPGGWNIAQIVNHLSDSHMNSFIRFKLTLTEEIPTIKPYFEDLWAELPDSKNCSINDALTILEGLHSKWSYLLRSMTDDELNRKFLHPESGKQISLKTNLGIYAWHCEHHLAHIRIAKKSQ